MSYEESPARNVDLETEHQYGSFASGALRWAIHNDHAVPPIGIMDPRRPEETNFGIEGEMMFLLELKGDESIADIACGDGRFIRRLLQMGHEGKLTGINYPSGPFIVAAMELQDNPQVEFIESDARDLRFPDGSPIPDNFYDIITSSNTLYHVEDWQKALSEFYRVLKPGGRLLVSTRDEDHQGKLWDSAELVARHMQKKLIAGKFTVNSLIHIFPDEPEGVDHPSLYRNKAAKIMAPESFYTHFDLAQAHAAASKLFRYTNVSYRQSSYSYLYAEDWDIYSLAAQQLFSCYTIRLYGKDYLNQSRGNEFLNSINRVIKPRFFKEIKKRGYFREYIEQGFDIFEKTAT